MVDQTFRASSDHELSSFDDARNCGIRAALAIGIEEVSNGAPYFGAEVIVEDRNKMLGRFLVSVGASSLQESQTPPALR